MYVYVYIYIYVSIEGRRERGHHERRWGSWRVTVYIYIYRDIVFGHAGTTLSEPPGPFMLPSIRSSSWPFFGADLGLGTSHERPSED